MQQEVLFLGHVGSEPGPPSAWASLPNTHVGQTSLASVTSPLSPAPPLCFQLCLTALPFGGFKEGQTGVPLFTKSAASSESKTRTARPVRFFSCQLGGDEPNGLWGGRGSTAASTSSKGALGNHLLSRCYCSSGPLRVLHKGGPCDLCTQSLCL